MSEPDSPQQPSVPEPGARRVAGWWWAVGAAVVAIAVIAVVLTRPDSTDDVAASTTTSAAVISPSKSAAPTPSVAPSGEPSQEPSASVPPDPGSPAPTQTVPVTGEGTPSPGVTSRVSLIEAVQGTAELPGEVGGPSLRVTVEVTNGTDAALDLTGAVVNLYYGADDAPALPLGQPGVQPFPSSAAAGAVASGTYVFNVPVDERGNITVELDLSVDSSTILFRGPAGV